MPGARPVAARAQLLELGRSDEALALLAPALVQQPDDTDLLCHTAYAWVIKRDSRRSAQIARRSSPPCRGLTSRRMTDTSPIWP